MYTKAPPASLKLPDPKTEGNLERALRVRRSRREFDSRQALTAAELSQLLFAAQGITDHENHRTAPSAGALYPLEVYLACEDGLYHYEPRFHVLKLRKPGDPRPSLCLSALGQECVGQAPAVFVFTAVFQRTAIKYQKRAERYVFLEAGHAAQNLLLEAAALDLAGVPIGAFDDTSAAQALDLSPTERVIYMIPVGHPR